MAIYHASLSTVARSAGRSSTSAAAYRSGELVIDERTGEVHDYTRKRGVIDACLILPGGQQIARSDFWNAVEKHHRRGDAQVARELIVAIPFELSRAEQIELAKEMGRTLAMRYSVAADVCVHEPSRDGHQANFHAHILMSGCTVDMAGQFGKKAVQLDAIHCKKNREETPAEEIRPIWERLANSALERAGSTARIDHRSNLCRGIFEAPGQHHGPTVTKILRRGDDSHVSDRQADDAVRITYDLLSRQMLDAAAAAEMLAALSAQAEIDVIGEMEAEWIQAEQVEAAQAEAEHAAQCQEIEKEQVAASRAALAKDQADREARQAQAAQALAKVAHEREQAAAAVHAAGARVKQAAAAVQVASRRLDGLRPAKDFAVAGLERAGESVWETAKALPKVPGWLAAVAAFDKAEGMWQKAVSVLDSARQVLLASAWQLDSGVEAARTAQQAKNKRSYEAQQQRIERISAATQGARAAIELHQRQHEHEQEHVPRF